MSIREAQKVGLPLADCMAPAYADRGNAVILQYAGADATAAYNQIHAPGVIEKGLSPDQSRGRVDEELLTSQPVETQVTVLPKDSKPPLSSLISVHDFGTVAQQNFTAKTWAFYSSAATDLVSHQMNLDCHRKLLLRPRVLRNVKNVTTRRRILGQDSTGAVLCQSGSDGEDGASGMGSWR